MSLTTADCPVRSGAGGAPDHIVFSSGDRSIDRAREQDAMVSSAADRAILAIDGVRGAACDRSIISAADDLIVISACNRPVPPGNLIAVTAANSGLRSA